MYFYIIYQSSLKKINRNQNKHFHDAREENTFEMCEDK